MERRSRPAWYWYWDFTVGFLIGAVVLYLFFTFVWGDFGWWFNREYGVFGRLCILITLAVSIVMGMGNAQAYSNEDGK